MVMNSAILLAHENQEVKASNEKQLQKKKQSRKQIATGEGFSIEEGQSLLQSRNRVDEAISATPAERVPEAKQHCASTTKVQ